MNVENSDTQPEVSHNALAPIRALADELDYEGDAFGVKRSIERRLRTALAEAEALLGEAEARWMQIPGSAMRGLTDAEEAALECSCEYEAMGCPVHGTAEDLRTIVRCLIHDREKALAERIAQAIEESAPTPGDAYARESLLGYVRSGFIAAARIARQSVEGGA